MSDEFCINPHREKNAMLDLMLVDILEKKDLTSGVKALTCIRITTISHHIRPHFLFSPGYYFWIDSDFLLVPFLAKHCSYIKIQNLGLEYPLRLFLFSNHKKTTD